MPVVNVYNTSVTTENISRFELLAWVNACMQSNLTKIEEMGTGAAYAQLTDFLFPGQIQLRKVRWNSRSEVDWINNWRVVQQSWKELGVAKPIPVQSLMKSKFQDNFEFLQWFKRFFDANYDGHEYDPLAARNNEEFPATLPGGKVSANKLAGVSSAPAPPPPQSRSSGRHHSTVSGPPKPAMGSAANPPSRPPPTTLGARNQTQTHISSNQISTGPKPRATAAAPTSTTTATAMSKLKEENSGLRSQVSELEGRASHSEAERNFYFGKLHAIEVMCQSAEAEGVETLAVKQILEVLYAEGDVETVETAAKNDNGVANNGVVEEGKAKNGDLEAKPVATAPPANDPQQVSQPTSELIVSPPTAADGESYASLGDMGMDEAFILDDTEVLNKTHDIINTTQPSHHPNGATLADGAEKDGRKSGDAANGHEDEPLISLESPDGGDLLNKTRTVSPKVEVKEGNTGKATSKHDANPLDDSETF